MDKTSSRFWTAANVLSLLRVLLIPAIVVALVRREGVAAFAIFAAAAMTDFLDGMAARTWGQRTKLGITLDPAADKLLMTASFVALSLRSIGGPNVIPLWLTGLVIGRDAAIALGALVIVQTVGPRPFLPSLWGKISTILQMGCVSLVLFFNMLGTTPRGLRWVYFLTLAATLVSAAHYFVARFLVWIRQNGR
jgi:cardiolipin synthase